MAVVIGIRHGEVHNPDGVIYAGLPGFGLSEHGRGQVSAVAGQVADAPVAAVYASPLDRAMQTAQTIAASAGVDVVADDRLHEWRHWAQWAGMTWEELRDRGREAWEAYHSDPGSVTEGESLAQLAERVGSWLDDVRAAHPEGIVIGVSHLEPLRAILLRLHDRPPAELFDITIGLAEAVRLHPDPDPQVRAVSELWDGYLTG